MRWWWQRELDEARERADRAEREQGAATRRRQEAERVDAHAKSLEDGLRRELARNGFAEALRAAFGGDQ